MYPVGAEVETLRSSGDWARAPPHPATIPLARSLSSPKMDVPSYPPRDVADLATQQCQATQKNILEIFTTFVDDRATVTANCSIPLFV